MAYHWQLNGTNLPDTTASYDITNLAATNDGTYTVTVSNIVGSNSATWNMSLALPGMAEAWGDNAYGECNRPANVTNVSAIAAGEYQSLAVSDTGSVLQWGQYQSGTNFYWVTNTSVASQPPNTSNFVAVAGGLDRVIALTSTGTLTNWGMTNSVDNYIPTNLSGVKAIGAGWAFNAALLTNGTVVAWGSNTYGQTNVPTGLSNVTAIATGAQHCLALSNGIVIAWGWNNSNQCNVPANLTNTVAIAAGDGHSMALLSTGKVVAWGANGYGQTNVPAGLSNVMAISAGGGHSVALLNDGTVVSWGWDLYGQTNIPTHPYTSSIYSNPGPPQTVTNLPVIVKLIAAGGNHTMAALYSPLVYYPVNPSKDLLLIYNTNSLYSSNVCQYYLTHRPMVSTANKLGIGCTTNETISPSDYTNILAAQVQTWLTNNPTKRPAYIILFQDIPSRVNTDLGPPYTNEFNGVFWASVQYQLHQWCAPPWTPFVTSINMNGTNGIGGTNDCIAYINKLAYFGSNYSPGQILINPHIAGYANTNYYFDGTNTRYPGEPGPASIARSGVLSVNPAASITYTNVTNDVGLVDHITNGLNVAGYVTWGYWIP